MNFFRERNKIQTEYSGYQQASEGLRTRLLAVVEERSGDHIGLGNEDFYLQRGLLGHEVKLRLNKDTFNAILQGSYDEVFEVVEIFLSLVHAHLNGQTLRDTLSDLMIAFRSAGSVYKIDQNGYIVLQLSEETAKNIANAEAQLGARSAEALDFFKRALHDLLSRERKANDVVKDFAVSIEDYIKALSKKKDYGEALRVLREQGIIAPTQQGVLDKLYAYRGDAHGVAHAGNTKEPGEADAMWFLETMVAQVKMIEAKIKTMPPEKQ